jgi:hypothetical protein
VPELNDSDDLDLDLEGDDQDADTDGDAGDGGTDADGDGKDPKKDEDKRVRDLQSKADKAEARANKLEKELQKARGEGSADGKPEKDPERAALLQELRESGLDAVYAENPELKTYGIARDLISGASRAEMREAATQLVGLIKSVETKVRNETLRKHGITPEPTGGTRNPPKNYAEMSPEEIEKEISRAKSGGAPGLW